MRVIDRILAALLAVALIAGGLLLTIEVIATTAFDEQGWLVNWDEAYRDGIRLLWDDRAVLVLSGIIAAVGLALILFALIPRRPKSIALPRTEGPPARISLRSIERSVDRAVSKVDGVDKSRIRADRDALDVRITTNRRQPGDLQERVRGAVSNR